MYKRKVLPFKLSMIVAIASSTLLFIALNYGWFGASGQSALMFCESLKHSLVKQPANTWSSISFILTGLRIGWEAKERTYLNRKNRLTKQSFYISTLAVMTVLLGIGSMAMHASTATVGGYLDMLSIYMIASFLFSYNTIRFFDLGKASFFFLMMTILVFCHLVHFRPAWFNPFNVNWAFLVFAIGATVLEVVALLLRRLIVNVQWMMAYIFTFLLSAAIWHFSLTGSILCKPDYLIQGHAVWHILCAITMYFVYRYYASEEEVFKENIFNG